MSSALPGPADDYTAPDAMDLSEAAWNAAFNSIGSRLRALEGVRADFEGLIAVGTGQALDVIRTNVEPQLAAVADAITALQTAVARAEDEVAAIVGGSVPQSAVAGLETALAARQPLDATLSALAAVATAADRLIYATGADVFATTPLTAFARTILDDTSAAAVRTTLGLGAAATLAVGTGANRIVQRDAAGLVPGIIGSAVVATTSGSVIDLTGIPATARRITVLLVGVSTSGTAACVLQLGSGALATSGYQGSVQSTSGGFVQNANFGTDITLSATSELAATTRHGRIVIDLVDPATFTYVFTGEIGYSNGAGNTMVAGSIVVGGAIDRLRLTMSGGANTFDTGRLSVLWEG